MQCSCYDAGHEGGQHRAAIADVTFPTQEEQREWIRCQSEADDDQYCTDCDAYQKSKPH
ncbi:MAG TPA: hypothetical protein VFF60_12175 [Candidatus Binatus sp.]|nr:hypothetical protein [Candidatus Binatus sp.]